ncbi:UNVERIFIED_CONTAM: hypothetical protein Sradi_1346700 [Sesamum radiatum]|uniref:Uncharacterized protein n=1 Tax=Sesamum radiatum TaxID=300843 RepID=A0AAW2URC4_SESRA
MNTLKENEWKVQVAKDDDQNKGREGNDKAKPDVEKDSAPRYKRFHEYTSLKITRARTLMNIEEGTAVAHKDQAKSYQKKLQVILKFHKDNGHDTENCFQLKDEINRLIRQSYLKKFIAKQENKKHEEYSPRRRRSRSPSGEYASGITFDDRDLADILFLHNNHVIITVDVANFAVQKVLVDSGSSADTMLKNVVERMDLPMKELKPFNTPLMGLGGRSIAPAGVLSLPTIMVRDKEKKKVANLNIKPEIKKKKVERIEPVEHKLIDLVPAEKERTTKIGSQLPKNMELPLLEFLR